MTKTACMLCGKEPPFEFQITRERDKEQDPDRKELEIHIKRKHSLDEIQKHLNPSEFNKKKALKEKRAKGEEQEQEQEQEQEGEVAVKTDDLVAELINKASGSGGNKPSASRSRSRGSSRSRRPAKKTEPFEPVVEQRDASSQDL